MGRTRTTRPAEEPRREELRRHGRPDPRGPHRRDRRRDPPAQPLLRRAAAAARGRGPRPARPRVAGPRCPAPPTRARSAGSSPSSRPSSRRTPTRPSPTRRTSPRSRRSSRGPPYGPEILAARRLVQGDPAPRDGDQPDVRPAQPPGPRVGPVRRASRSSAPTCAAGTSRTSALILSSKAQGRPVQETETFARLEPRHPGRDVRRDDDARRLPPPPPAADPGGDRPGAREVRLRRDAPAPPGHLRADQGHLPAPPGARSRLLHRAARVRPKYFQGDEWVIRLFLRSELDVRNVLLLLKGKDAELPFEAVADAVPRRGRPRAAPWPRTSTRRGRVPEIDPATSRAGSRRSRRGTRRTRRTAA